MIKKLIDFTKDKFTFIYFFLLFLLLLYIYLPSFSHPFRSDYWSIAYFFHQLSSFGLQKWLSIFQYDAWGHIRFQPLASLLLYFEWSLFGSNSLYFQILNFSLYFISLILLYRLALNFCKSKVLIFAFLATFAFLFSHFDIICWSYHVYVLFGFCCFLLGFILYINYLKSQRRVLLFLVILLFLSGMLCYESFILWPLAIIILNYTTEKNRSKKSLMMSSLLVISLTYLFYIAGFFLFSKFKPQVLLSNLFSIHRAIYTLPIPFINLLYNGFLVNIFPFLVCPLRIDVNISMRFALPMSYFILGLFSTIFLWVTIYLYRRRYFKTLKIINCMLFTLFFTLLLLPPKILKLFLFLDKRLFILYAMIFMLSAFTIYLYRNHLGVLKKITFFLFLLFTEFFILSYARSITNPLTYIFRQFRYQYIPNAFTVLIILLLTDGLWKLSKRRQILVCLILLIILILNISTTRICGLSVLDQNLAPLKRLFSNIKIGIKNGKINRDNKLYIDDSIAKKRLPSLCWNKDMGKFFIRKGTYQWAFSRKEIEYFSFSIEDAKWVIDEKTLGIVIKKSEE